GRLLVRRTCPELTGLGATVAFRLDPIWRIGLVPHRNLKEVAARNGGRRCGEQGPVKESGVWRRAVRHAPFFRTAEPPLSEPSSVRLRFALGSAQPAVSSPARVPPGGLPRLQT